MKDGFFKLSLYGFLLVVVAVIIFRTIEFASKQIEIEILPDFYFALGLSFGIIGVLIFMSLIKREQERIERDEQQDC